MTWYSRVTMRAGVLIETPQQSLNWYFDRWLITIESQTNPIIYSYNGMDWKSNTNIKTIITDSVNSVFYNGTIWLAGCDVNETINLSSINYSYDGIEWYSSSSGNVAITGSCNKFDYGSSLIYGCGHTSNSLAYSSDGITWTGLSNSLTLLHTGNDIIWDGSTWVCVGIKGTNSNATPIATSTDGGITWTNLLTAPTSSECKTITWNGKLWILTLNSTTFYTSYDLITWTTIVHEHTVYVGRSNYILPHKGHNLYKFTNDNFRDYDTSLSTFSPVTIPITCYGEVSISADSNVTITNLPYKSITSYIAVAQTTDSVSTSNFTYGQAEIISGSSIKIHNQENATRSVSWYTLGKTINTLTKLTNSNLGTALSLWISNKALAEYEYGHISDWDVSNVTSMYRVFYNKTITDDISRWDVSNVTTMEEMFSHSSFNQPIGNWDVGNVTNMKLMFYNQYTSFNQDISKWNVSKVTTMYGMFFGFHRRNGFNKPIGDWDVSNVTNMEGMFRGSNFDQDISNWNVISLSDGSAINIFSTTNYFNQSLKNWNVSNITTTYAFFINATAFNGDLSNWDVSKVTNFMWMLNGATNFNKPIGKWNVSKVTDMYGAFEKTSNFNQDISQWNVSNVTRFQYTFWNSSKFNQDLSHWVLKSTLTNMATFLSGTGIDSANYTKMLIAWAAQENAPVNVSFGAPSISYYDIATDAYTYLTNTLKNSYIYY